MNATRRMGFWAGWNLPGCLPEMEPAWFADAGEAREFLADDAQSMADGYEQGDEYGDRWEALAAEIRADKGGVYWGAPNGYAYYIEPGEEPEERS